MSFMNKIEWDVGNPTQMGLGQSVYANLKWQFSGYDPSKDQFHVRLEVVDLPSGITITHANGEELDWLGEWNTGTTEDFNIPLTITTNDNSDTITSGLQEYSFTLTEYVEDGNDNEFYVYQTLPGSINVSSLEFDIGVDSIDPSDFNLYIGGDTEEISVTVNKVSGSGTCLVSIGLSGYPNPFGDPIPAWSDDVTYRWTDSEVGSASQSFTFGEYDDSITHVLQVTAELAQTSQSNPYILYYQNVENPDSEQLYQLASFQILAPAWMTVTPKSGNTISYEGFNVPTEMTSEGYTAIWNVEYVQDIIEQGSDPAIDLTLQGISFDTGMTPSFKTVGGGSTITTIPYYGNTNFEVHCAVDSAFDDDYFGYLYHNLKVRAHGGGHNIYSHQFNLIVSEEVSAQYIDSFEPDQMQLIAGGDTASSQDITIHRIYGNETVHLTFPDLPQYVNSTEEVEFVFDGSSGDSLTKTMYFEAEEGSGEIVPAPITINVVNDDGDIRVTTLELNIGVTGAVISFSLVGDNTVTCFGGQNIVVPAILSLEDNGVPAPTLNFITAGAPGSMEFQDVQVTPSHTGVEVDINASVDHNAPSQDDVIITLTFYKNNISVSKTITLDIIFTSVSRPEANPIINNNGVLRFLPGNAGVIRDRTAQGLWWGYIDRTYFNKKYNPSSKFYSFPTDVDPFTGEFSLTGQADSSAGFADETVYYRIAQIYDGNQRSLLSPPIEADYNGSSAEGESLHLGKFAILIPKSDFNLRVTELEVYRSTDADGSYDRILNVPTADNVIVKNDYNSALTDSTITDFTGDVKSRYTHYLVNPSTGFPIFTHDPNQSIMGYPESALKSSSFAFMKGGYNGSMVANYHLTGVAEWDYYQQMTTDADGIVKVQTVTAESGTEDIYAGAITPSVSADNFFHQQIVIENMWWAWYIGWHWTNAVFWMRPTAKMYRGKDVIYCTADTGTQDRLKGKFLQHGSEIRQVVQNRGKFIQTDQEWSVAIDGGTFEVLDTMHNIEYTNPTVDGVSKLKITFNDPFSPAVGTTPIEGEISTKINGKVATMMNGRLFQGDLILDPGDVNEVQPYWVSYSELDQPDVNPVSNVLRFVDREGGTITGLAGLQNRLAVLKDQGLFLVNCPPNITPENWSVSESIHNIGNIAPRGYIAQGDVLYTIFGDGIYKLSANNFADSDKTPTERLKITDPIQNVFDEIYDKADIISIYDQYKDEILFRWHRNPTNFVRNSSFKNGENYWDVFHESGFIDTEYHYSGSYSLGTHAQGTASTKTGCFGEFIPIDPEKYYTASVFGWCPEMTNGNFYANWLYYDKNKTQIPSVYPNLFRREFAMEGKGVDGLLENFEQEVKNIVPIGGSTAELVHGHTVMPLGTKYIRMRSYWWSNVNSSTKNNTIEPPEGRGYVDCFQVSEGKDISDYTEYEDSQEIWGYNVNKGTWREIKTSASIGAFALDGEGGVIAWDDKTHKIVSFNKKESITATFRTHPIALTTNRSEVVRQIISKIKSEDDLIINIIGDGDTGNQLSRTLSTQTRPSTEKHRLSKRCKDVQLEIIAPASTNSVEIHNIEMEYT